MRNTSAALAAAALCLALTSCGDDSAKDSNGSDEPKTLTKAELIEQGDAICKASNARIESAASGLDENTPEAVLLAYVTDDLLPEIEGQSRDLRALKAPAEDAAEYEKMLDSLDAAVAGAKADPTLVFGEAETFGEANRIATQLGFKECGEEE